jgi:hypothetical protein
MMHKWKARTEFEKLLHAKDRESYAAARNCGWRNAGCNRRFAFLIAALNTPDLEVAQAAVRIVPERTATSAEADMFTAQRACAEISVSKWNEDGLMAAGYHWVDLNRTTAIIDYQRVAPNGSTRTTVNGAAWVAYLIASPMPTTG